MRSLLTNFKLFGGAHFVYLILAIALVVGLFFVLRKQIGTTRKYIGIALISVAGLFVVLEFVGRLIEGGKVFENLPLAPWQIFVYIGIFVTVTHRESWVRFGYLISLPLCVIGLFVAPNYYLEVSGFSLSVISYFLGNAVLILYCLLQIMWSEEGLYKRDIINTTLNYIIIIAFVHIFNVIMRFTTLAVHSNYFGTMGEEYDAIMKLVYGWISIPFVHLLPLFAVLIGIEFLLVLPFDLIKNRKEKADQIEELVALGNLKAQQEARKNSKKGGSQILIRGEHKAQPTVQKNVSNNSKKDGFVSVTKTVQTNNDKSDK